MKHLKISLLALTFLGIGFFACKKQPSIKNVDKINYETLADSTDLDPDSIGYYHNEMVTEVIQELVYNNGLSDLENYEGVEEIRGYITDRIVQTLSTKIEIFYQARGLSRSKSEIVSFLNSFDPDDFLIENSSVFTDGLSTEFQSAIAAIDQKGSDYNDGLITVTQMQSDMVQIFNNSNVPTAEEGAMYQYTVIAMQTHPLWKANAEEWSDDLTGNYIVTWPIPAHKYGLWWSGVISNVWEHTPKADKQGGVAGFLAGGPGGALEGAALGSLVDALWP